MLQGQVEAYKLNHNEYPASVSDLVEQDYIMEEDLRCPDNTEIKIENGKVIGPATEENT